MSIVLGFGKTEEVQRNEFENSIREIILNNHTTELTENKLNRDIFSEKEREIIKNKIINLAKELREQDDEFEKNDYKNAPDRYFYCWVTVVSTVCDIFVGVAFHHINTKHPMSPDGIALLAVNQSYWFNYDDINEELKYNQEKYSKED